MARRKLTPQNALHMRHKPGEMNQTEAAYAKHLNLLMAAGEVHEWWFEAMKIKVSYDTNWITIDFMIQFPDGHIELHDVKGGATEDDAAVKMKVAADLYPFPIYEARLKRGKWEMKRIGE